MKRLKYITGSLKKSHNGFCKVNGFLRENLSECFERRVESNLNGIRETLPEKSIIPIGLRTYNSAPMFLRFATMGLETNYNAKSVEWDMFALGLEYFFVGWKVKLTERRLRFKVDRTKFLSPLAAAILVDRKDMIRFYQRCWADGPQRNDENIDLMRFIECILSEKPTKDCGVFSVNPGDDISEKLEQLLDDHHENSLFKKNVPRPFYQLPYNHIPVHIFLWLKHHNFKDQYGLHDFIPCFENMTYQHDELLLKIETEYAEPIN